jgi:hypothetical protein
VVRTCAAIGYILATGQRLDDITIKPVIVHILDLRRGTCREEGPTPNKIIVKYISIVAKYISILVIY